MALSLGLEVHTPASMRDPEVIADFQALKLDAAVVVAFGQILPAAVLDAPGWVPLTCTPPFCHGGAVRPRFSGPLWPATGNLGFRSCA